MKKLCELVLDLKIINNQLQLRGSDGEQMINWWLFFIDSTYYIFHL